MTRFILAAMLVPAIAAAQPDQQPDQVEVYDAWNGPVFTTGAIVFLGSYGASVAVAGSSDHPGADELYIPLAGPWLALADWGRCPVTDQACGSSAVDKVLLIGDGIFQAGGIVTMIDAIFEPSHHSIDMRTADTKLHIAPTHNGVTMFAHF